MHVKLILILFLMVTTVEGGWWGRRRRRNSSSGRGLTVSGSLQCPGGRCQGTISAEKKWGTRTSLSGHLTYGRGGLGAGVKFTHRFRRDLKYADKFEVNIALDPCSFDSYDRNDNNKIEREEVVFLFGDDVLTDVFFQVLDTNGDGFISIDEFNSKAPKYIASC